MNRTILTYDELSLPQQEAMQSAIGFINSLEILIRRAIPATIITERRYHVDGMHVYWYLAINPGFLPNQLSMEVAISRREVNKPDYHQHIYMRVISAWAEAVYGSVT